MNSLEDRLRAALVAKSDAVTLDWAADRRMQTSRSTTTVAPPAVLHLAPKPATRPVRRAPSLLAAAAAVVFALLVSAVSGDWSHRSGPGRPSSQAGIPWSQVGPDWRLTVSSTATAVNGTLYLLDPAGQRYQICLLPASYRQLDQWSFTTGRALVTGDSVSPVADQVLLVNLRTGSQVKL